MDKKIKPMLKEGVENLALWNEFFKTDPSYTKDFKRAGGFEGTAITPMLAAWRMTEKFGPMGQGWGIECMDVRTHELTVANEVLVYILVGLWYCPEKGGARFMAGPQWGGDKIQINTKSGARGDDEAYKKAMTDGFIKCASYLGIGADIHTGMFDDVKYFTQLEKEFSTPEKGKAETKAADKSPEAGEAITNADVEAMWKKLYEVEGRLGNGAEIIRQMGVDRQKAWLKDIPKEDADKRRMTVYGELKKWIKEAENAFEQSQAPEPPGVD